MLCHLLLVLLPPTFHLMVKKERERERREKVAEHRRERERRAKMMKKRKQHSLQHLLFLSNAFFFLLVSSGVTHSTPPVNLLLPSESSALLDFKSKADFKNSLRSFSTNTSFHHCNWQGIKCVRGKVIRLVLEGFTLGGVFASDTLTRLDQLRVLSLQNNSLTGPIPDLSQLVNLKSLFLDHNSFSGYFPRSISSLHRIRTVDFSYNNLTGSIPAWLSKLDRLYYLRLDWNRFNGSIPPLNQTSLQTFNVSGNNLTGAIPVTPAMLRFPSSSFSWNFGLCGEILNKECGPGLPFFGPSAAGLAAPPPSAASGQNAELNGVELTQPRPKNHNRFALISGFSFGVLVLIGAVLCFIMAVKKQRRKRSSKVSTPAMAADSAAAAEAAAVMRIEEENELEQKVKRKVEVMQVAKSGSLVFCAGEAQVYTLDQLMRGSAELLGRGTLGTTYKAVLDNRLIVCVKRLDGGKTAVTSQEMYEQHMGSVGGLRHPNLVPLRAFFQAKEERLLIYDYQPNGSLFSLIHGSKSTRAKPLHWTSCLKIAEDVAQGLSYIHQAWRLVHGNLKSSNVLLGPDFEACLTDYCLSVLATTSSSDDEPNCTAYKAPEIRKSNHPATSKSDVYAFGILLLELLTGKPPSQHPYLMPNDDLLNWVRSTREDDNGDDRSLEMLVEVAVDCSVTSPEQRPTMWQVLKMIQEIKETLFVEDEELDPSTGVLS